MADNYTALKSSQKKRYISKETFNSLDLTQIPVGSEYDIVGPIDKGDLSAEINNSLNKADNSLQQPTNQTTGSNGDVLVKTTSGSEWQTLSTGGGEAVTPSGATTSATSGTFTSAEWTKLQADNNNYILFNNEIYRLADTGHEGTEGIWSYVHTGWDGTAMRDKSINVTVSTGAWTLVQGSSGSDINVVQSTGQSTTDVMSQKAVTDNLAQITTLTFENESNYDFVDVEVVTGITAETDQNSITIKLTDTKGGDIRNSFAVGMPVEFYDANGDSTDVDLSIISYINYTTGEVHLATYSGRKLYVGEIFAPNFMRLLNREFTGPEILTDTQKNAILTNPSSVIKYENDIYSLYHINSLNTLRVYLLNLNTYSETIAFHYSTQNGVVNRTRIVELVRDVDSDTWYACQMISPRMFDFVGVAKSGDSKVQITVNKNIIAQPGLLLITFTGKEFTCTESAFNQLIVDMNLVDWGDNNLDDDYKHTYSQSDDYIINFQPFTKSNVKLPSILLSNTTGPKKVVVGDAVTKIGGGFCNGCTTLEEFVIGKNVTDITSFSIISGTPIKTLRVLATTPPTCASYDAQVPNLEKIIVPKDSINIYKSADGWSAYADKIVYEVDSSDLPDTSKFAKLSGGNSFYDTQKFIARTPGETRVTNTGVSVYTNSTTHNDQITFYKFNSISNKVYTGETTEIWNYSFPSKSGTFALTSDTSNLSSFSVEVW